MRWELLRKILLDPHGVNWTKCECEKAKVTTDMSKSCQLGEASKDKWLQQTRTQYDNV